MCKVWLAAPQWSRPKITDTIYYHAYIQFITVWEIHERILWMQHTRQATIDKRVKWESKEGKKKGTDRKKETEIQRERKMERKRERKRGAERGSFTLDIHSYSGPLKDAVNNSGHAEACSITSDSWHRPEVSAGWVPLSQPLAKPTRQWEYIKNTHSVPS